MQKARTQLLVRCALLSGLGLGLAGCASSAMPPPSPQYAGQEDCSPRRGDPVINAFSAIRMSLGETPDQAYICPPGSGDGFMGMGGTLNRMADDGEENQIITRENECVLSRGTTVEGRNGNGELVVACVPQARPTGELGVCARKGGVLASAGGRQYICVGPKGNKL